MMAQASYRVAFVAAAATYGIVVYKGYAGKIRLGDRGGIPALAMKLLADENVQYLGAFVPADLLCTISDPC
jgi:hypothetical protein